MWLSVIVSRSDGIILLKVVMGVTMDDGLFERFNCSWFMVNCVIHMTVMSLTENYNYNSVALFPDFNYFYRVSCDLDVDVDWCNCCGVQFLLLRLTHCPGSLPVETK